MKRVMCQTYKILLNISYCLSCGMDPHPCADRCGDTDRLLLLSGTVDPCGHSLLHPGLEVVNLGFVFALLFLLPLLMVRCETLSLIVIHLKGSL